MDIYQPEIKKNWLWCKPYTSVHLWIWKSMMFGLNSFAAMNVLQSPIFLIAKVRTFENDVWLFVSNFAASPFCFMACRHFRSTAAGLPRRCIRFLFPFWGAKNLPSPLFICCSSRTPGFNSRAISIYLLMTFLEIHVISLIIVRWFLPEACFSRSVSSFSDCLPSPKTSMPC